MSRIKPTYKLIGLAILLTVAHVAAAQDFNPEHHNVSRDGVSISGYDVVSYFIGSPVRGEPGTSEDLNGITFWFSTEENRKIFIKNPDKFIPAYGGWCAFAMGNSGKKVKIDPETYKIIEGRLHLFYNFYGNNSLIDWNEDETYLRQRADTNWQKMNEP